MSLMTMGIIDPTAAAQTVAQSLVKSRAAAATTATTTTSSSSADSGNVISSSDFMTLLVTEMKNQDPTQPTDPNAYIQQLVGVNSLQQLISINQDLSGSTTSTGTTGATGGVQPASGS